MVKQTTHIIFSVSTALLVAKILSVLGLWPLKGIPFFLLAVASSFLVNTLIDSLGHTKKENIPVRTSFSHSSTGATIFALASTTIISTSVYLMNFTPLPLPEFSFPVLVAETLIISLTCGYTHLLADLPTEGGIFYRGKRVKFGGFRYDGPINMFFIIISAFMLFFS